MMLRELDDDTVLQAGLRTLATEQLSADLITLPITGVVSAIHYPGDDDNLCGYATEYSVILASRHIVRNVQCSASVGGYLNGLDKTLNPATKDLDGNALDLTLTPLESMDGDHVLLIAPYGLGQSLIIIDVLPHPRAEYSAVKADGKKVTLKHQDLTITLDNDGQLIAERDKAKFTLYKDNKIEVEVNGTILRTIDGTIEGLKATASALLKESFMNYVESFFTNAFNAAKLGAVPNDGGKAGFGILEGAMSLFTSGGSAHPTTVLKGE